MSKHTVATSRHAMLLGIGMLALLPHPHELCVVAAATVLGYSELAKRAQSSAILTAACLSLAPSCVMQAAANALVRVTTNAKRRIKSPTKLGAAVV